MTPQALCQACGTRPTREDALLQLTMPGKAGAKRALTLCEDCLERRQTDAWPVDGAEGRRLREALEALDAEPAERYTYLLDEAEVHLVRLRPDWVAQHAAPA